MAPRQVVDVVTRIYFTDFFDVDPDVLEHYGAFNISLIGDLPLFIDPFLLFSSDKSEYQQLHSDILNYLRFLRDKSVGGAVSKIELRSWYRFKEVKQNWLGFATAGNIGSGLGAEFSERLHRNLSSVFRNFGLESITRSSHLEKVCLIANGVGRDNISDFATCLIKEFLLNYTQDFARKHIAKELRRTQTIQRVRFNYELERWEARRFELPYINGDFVILTPKDILTRDEIWISRRDLFHNFEQLADAIPDAQLREELNRYLAKALWNNADKTTDELREAKRASIEQIILDHPEVIEYYIKEKENTADTAKSISRFKTSEIETWYIDTIRSYVSKELAGSQFFSMPFSSMEEARARALFYKHVVEHEEGYKLFYLNGKRVGNEKAAQIIFRFVWFASLYDTNPESNHGRGPVDMVVSLGRHDKSLVEFKLASNSKLRLNLEHQVEIYKQSSRAQSAIKIICFFTAEEEIKVKAIMKELGLEGLEDIILIDARSDNKPSASKATFH